MAEVVEESAGGAHGHAHGCDPVRHPASEASAAPPRPAPLEQSRSSRPVSAEGKQRTRPKAGQPSYLPTSKAFLEKTAKYTQFVCGRERCKKPGALLRQDGRPRPRRKTILTLGRKTLVEWLAATQLGQRENCSGNSRCGFELA